MVARTNNKPILLSFSSNLHQKLGSSTNYLCSVAHTANPLPTVPSLMASPESFMLHGVAGTAYQVHTQGTPCSSVATNRNFSSATVLAWGLVTCGSCSGEAAQRARKLAARAEQSPTARL